MGIQAAGLTDVGCVRKHNEDALLCLPDLGLVAVADGLGGHAAGEVASRIVVDTLRMVMVATQGREDLGLQEGDPPVSLSETRLRAAIRLADQAIADDIADHPERQSMGSTVVVGLVEGRQVTLAHVGDSRAYLITQEGIRQLTQDHSWVAEQVARGQLTPAEARAHPFRNVITQALGSGGDLEISVQSILMQEMESLLLCSDGLSGMLSDPEIWEVVVGSAGIEEAVEALVGRAKAQGGEDNITVVLVNWQLGQN